MAIFHEEADAEGDSVVPCTWGGAAADDEDRDCLEANVPSVAARSPGDAAEGVSGR